MTPRRRLAALVGVACVAALVSGASAAPGAPVADAAMRQDVEAVRTLLKQGADVNAAHGDGMTALHWASEHGNDKLAAILLAAGANVRAVTRIGGYTPLHIASKGGSEATVKALIAGKSDVKAVTTSGATALHFAAAAGNPDAVTALIAAGADPNARENEWGQTPLMFAAAANRPKAITALIKGGAQPSLATKAVVLTEQATLDQSASRKRNEVLAAFRGGDGRQGGPPPAPSQMQAAIEAGRTVYAASQNVDTTKLVEVADTANGEVAGFAGSVGSMGGLTALHHAVRQGNLDAVVALLDGGADINKQTDGDKTTPLLMATINGQFDVAMKLIERGADPKVPSAAGATPLYATINTQWAPRSRFPQPQSVQNQKTPHITVMEALLKAGADPNVRIRTHLWYFAYNNCGNGNCGLENLEGTTPFWRAAYSVDVEAMRLLVAHGADTKIPSQRTAGAGGGRGGGGRGGGGRGGGGRGGRGGGDPDDPPVAGPPAAAGGQQVATAGAPGQQAAQRGGGRGRGAGGGGGGRGQGVDPVEARLQAAVEGARAQAAGGARVDSATTTADSTASRVGRLTPLDSAAQAAAAQDSAARAVPAGVGVYPVHAAAGVGYGNGFAGNSHRHAPDGWMPAMKYLVEELGADVNARDQTGYTPLHHAAARGDNEMILYLVSKGADPKAVARNGRTTVDMANGPVQRLRPYLETIALLEKLGAKNNHRCVSC